MKDLSLHILDILENSARAGATRVLLRLVPADTWLELELTDNGPGLPPVIREDPTDPFRTTRTDRTVGMGLGLLRAAAEQTGGRFEIDNSAAGGIRLRATFQMSHLDAKPLGALDEAVMAAVVGWPGLDLEFRLGNRGVPVLDTAAVKAELEPVPITHPEALAFLRRQLHEATAELHRWAVQAADRAGTATAATVVKGTQSRDGRKHAVPATGR